jgi:hypothetical protein
MQHVSALPAEYLAIPILRRTGSVD